MGYARTLAVKHWTVSQQQGFMKLCHTRKLRLKKNWAVTVLPLDALNVRLQLVVLSSRMRTASARGQERMVESPQAVNREGPLGSEEGNTTVIDGSVAERLQS